MKFIDLNISAELATQKQNNLVSELQEKGFQGIGIVYDAVEKGSSWQSLKEIKVSVASQIILNLY